MTGLMNAIADIVANSPPNKVDQLASIITAVSGPEAAPESARWTTVPEAKRRYRRLIDEWSIEDTISSTELAAMLRAAGYVHDRLSATQSVELVWTGPSSALVPTRKTERALIQVIQSAEKKLFLTSFVAYKVGAIVAALNRAIERGVAVSILLERSDSEGGGVSIDGIGEMKKALPEARVFAWDEKEDEHAGGKVHAKVAVADERVCFVSSANLTGHAMEKNMEAGVLIEGGDLPTKLHRHLEALFTTKQLRRA